MGVAGTEHHTVLMLRGPESKDNSYSRPKRNRILNKARRLLDDVTGVSADREGRRKEAEENARQEREQMETEEREARQPISSEEGEAFSTLQQQLDDERKLCEKISEERQAVRQEEEASRDSIAQEEEKERANFGEEVEQTVTAQRQKERDDAAANEAREREAREKAAREKEAREKAEQQKARDEEAERKKILSMEGWMEKFAIGRSAVGAKNWQRRYFTLTVTDGLRYYKEKGEKSPLGTVPMKGTRLISSPTTEVHPEVQSAEKDFCLVWKEGNEELKLLLRTAGKKEHDEWVLVVSNVIGASQ